jgi:hypothetical protein
MYELSPDGRRSIETYRTLEQAIERAQVLLLTSRVDVQNFHIYVTSGFGHKLIGLVSRDKGFRPAATPGEEEGA